MVDILLKGDETGYDAVGTYILRYWEHNIPDDVIVSLGISYDGNTYDLVKEVAYPAGFCGNDIEFVSDWWEGQKYIKLFGIKTVKELDIYGGIYDEEE